MMADAKAHDLAARARLVQAQQTDERERASLLQQAQREQVDQITGSFLHDMKKTVYLRS